MHSKEESSMRRYRSGIGKLGISATTFLVLLICVAPSALAVCCPTPGYPGFPDVEVTVSTISSGGSRIAICLAGDLSGLTPPGASILVQVRDCASGAPITGLLPRHFEVDGQPLAAMADGWNPGGVPAGSPPRHNLNGFTVVAPGDYLLDVPILGGGCGNGLNVKVLDCLIMTGAPLAQGFVSPDMNGDGAINLSDIGAFASCFLTPGCLCCDLTLDGVCNLADVGVMAIHYGDAYPAGFGVDPVD
jgi:hypothetical protein